MKQERIVLMDLIDAVNIKFDCLNREYDECDNVQEKQLLHFKATIIKNVQEDALFLVESDIEGKLSIRNANLIIRNMVEQLIEYLYLLNHQNLIKEYLGENIPNIKTMKGLNLSKVLGKERFACKREHVVSMAKDIGRYKNNEGMTLYDVYCVLSEMCHNSYFISLLDDYRKDKSDTVEMALSTIQIQLIQIILSMILEE